MMKTCKMCKDELPVEMFSINDKKRGYRRPECRDCYSYKKKLEMKRRRATETPKEKRLRQEYHRDYFQALPDEKKAKWREGNKKAYHTLREEILLGLGGRCVKCRVNDLNVLQIDHVNGGGGQERKEVGHTKSYRIIRDRIRANDSSVFDEIQLMCANCHHLKSTRRR